MDKDFEKKKIKPSDTALVYDTQIDFESGDEDASELGRVRKMIKIFMYNVYFCYFSMSLPIVAAS